MVREIEIALLPEEAGDGLKRKIACATFLEIDNDRVSHVEVIRRSIDARKSPVKIRLRCLVYVDEQFQSNEEFNPHYQNVKERPRVNIIGSGPAGYTAAIYAARANLSPVLYTGPEIGGQLMITTDVENYPGYPTGITGPEMMEDLRKQAERFGTRIEYEDITKVDLEANPKKLWTGGGIQVNWAHCGVVFGRVVFGEVVC